MNTRNAIAAILIATAIFFSITIAGAVHSKFSEVKNALHNATHQVATN